MSHVANPDPASVVSVPTDLPPLHAAARASLASVALAAVAITVNHLYALGPKALILGAA